MNLFRKKLGIVGNGIEGKSLFAWLKKHKANHVFVFDEKSSPEEKVYPFSSLDRCEKFFRSPGIHPKKIISHGVSPKNISSSSQLFFEISPTKNIIGVTGTKGKGTTSTLIYKILEQNWQSRNGNSQLFLGGNIGTPIFDFFDDIHPQDTVVLEMSSFQLFDLKNSPKIAVLLRTDTEHLDWHSDTQDYRNAKKNVFLHQKKDDFLVVFGESDITLEMTENAKSKKIFVFPSGKKSGCERQIYTENGEIFYEEKWISFLPFSKKTKLLNVKDVQLRGKFHLENVLAACAVAHICGVSPEVMQEVVKKFSGLPMRCELVAEKKGRKFFDDSFSTIPETTISALSIFSSPVFLVLGGSEKNSDFSALAEVIAKNPHIKKMYLIGQTAERIAKALQKCNIQHSTFKIFSDLPEIFSDFEKNSEKGDCLLLSPGCASFGMFANYKERGRFFDELAKKSFENGSEKIL